jgi:hypothetical protein
MTPSQIASRIVAYARAQADQLEGPERYECLIMALGELAKVRDEPKRRPSAFLRAIAHLEDGAVVRGED